MILIDSSLFLLATPAMPPPPSWLLNADPLSEDEEDDGDGEGDGDGDGELELLEPSEFEKGLELADPVVIWPF